MPRRILALVSEPVSGEALKKAVGRERAEGAEVLVVAPALTTRTRFWLSDVDTATKRAEEVQEETVARMDRRVSMRPETRARPTRCIRHG